MDKKRQKVVIIGAGFAGINIAHELRNSPVDITIVDRNNFHTFQPLLYQVATGYLAAEEVGETIRSIFRRQDNVDVVVADAIGVDWEQQHLKLSSGHFVQFDTLVVAAGATANVEMIPGMAEHGRPLYAMTDAIALRQTLLKELEVSVLEREGPHGATVVVVGGGPTGVEMSGALESMAKDLLGAGAPSLRVVLVEAADRLLLGFDDRAGANALHSLQQRGVDVRLKTKVESVDAHKIYFEDGSSIDTNLVIWAAGVRQSGIGSLLQLPVDEKRGIIVKRTLQVEGKPNVWVAGDAAFVKDKPVPLLAPAAIQMGKHIAKQIDRGLDGREPREFRYFDKGMMAVIGRWSAVAELPIGMSFTGRIAWLLWLFIHILYLVGFRNRIKVITDWGWEYFTSRGASAILVNNRKDAT